MQPDEKFPLLPEFGRLRDEESFKSDFLHLVSFSFIDREFNIEFFDIAKSFTSKNLHRFK